MRTLVRLVATISALTVASAGCGGVSESDPTAPLAAPDDQATATSTTIGPVQNWDSVTLGKRPTDSNAVIVTRDESLVVATITDGGLAAWRSDDGATYQPAEPGPVSAGYPLMTDVAWGANGLIAVGNNYEAMRPLIWQSENGTHWELFEGPPGLDRPVDLNTVVATPDGFVAGGALRLMEDLNDGPFEAAVWHTSDGSTWDLVVLAPATDSYVADMVFADGQVIAVGQVDGKTTIWRSDSQGISWTEIDTVGLDDMRWFSSSSIAATNGTIVLVGSQEGQEGYGYITILTSDDAGNTWEQVDLSNINTEGIGYWGVVRGASAGFWLVTSRFFDAWRNPDRCYVDLASCTSGDMPALFFSEDGDRWSEIDVAAFDTVDHYSIYDVAVTGTGHTTVVGVTEALTAWSWPDPTATPPAVATPSTPPETPEFPLVEWRGHLDPGITYRYPLYIHCGMGYLGEFNGSHWYLDSGGTHDFDNEDWPIAQQSIFGFVTLTDSGAVEYSIPSGEVIGTYLQSHEEPPGCA